MTERLTVNLEDLRRAARGHADTAEQLNAVSAGNADIMASLESLGPVFAELRDAGRVLLDQRRACYQEQAAAHADLADKLNRAADLWQQQDVDDARRLRAIPEGGR